MEKRIEGYFKKSIEVEKSEFIGYAFNVDSKEDFLNKFNEIKKEHNKARHHCYAYIIDKEIKYSDDGEPQGTAGRPILGVIEKNNLNHIAVVVVRYFGGTLLGAGRLLRTYVESAIQVLRISDIFEMIEENLYIVYIEIELYNQFQNYLKKNGFSIKNTKFSDKITIEFFASLDFNEEIESIFYPKLKIVSKEKIKHKKEVIINE